MSEGVARAPVRDARGARLRAHLREPFYRSAYALIVNTGATSVLGFAYWIFAAHRFSQADLGRGSALIAAMVTLSNLSQLNLWTALGRFLPVSGRRTTRLVMGSYLVATVGGLAAGAGFVLLAPLLSTQFRYLADDPALSVGFCLAVACWGIFALQDAVLTGLRRAPWVPIENTAFGVVKILFLFCLVGTLHTSGIFASWTVPVAISLLPVNYLIFRRLLPEHRRTYRGREEHVSFRSVARFVRYDYTGYVFLQASTTLLPTLVVAKLGSTQGAVFYTAWLLTSSLDLLASNVSISLTVEGSHDPDRLPQLLRRLLTRALPLAATVTLVVFVAAPALVALFGAKYTGPSSTLLRILVLGVVPRAVNQLALAVARVRQRLRAIVVVQAATCLAVLGGGAALSPRFGVLAVGISWAAGQTLVAVGVLAVLPRWLRGPAPARVVPVAARAVEVAG